MCACSFSGSSQEHCLLPEPRLSNLLAHLRDGYHGYHSTPDVVYLGFESLSEPILLCV